MENDAQISKDLVSKEEDEPTSPESHEKIKDEVVNTTPKMAPWGEMHEELKIEEVTLVPKAEECTIKLFKETEATIVLKKKYKI